MIDVYMGPRERRLLELELLAWDESAAEGGLGGLGVVAVIRLARRGPQKTRGRLVWTLNGEKMAGRKIYGLARTLDAFERGRP